MLRLKVILHVRRASEMQLKRFCSQGTSANFPSTGDEGSIKRQILDASLKYVPDKGWTTEAVSLGASELKYPDIMHGVFNDPGASLVQHYIQSSNNRLVDHMKTESGRLNQTPKISFSNFVSNAVIYRLRLNVPYMGRMSEALSIATRPDQLPESLKLLLKMCDDICFFAGDRSTDYTWYTKRTSLAGLYASSELYMIQDKSLDYEDTWKFMRRRFDDLNAFGQSTKQILSTPQMLVDAAYTLYVVGRNAIGANTESRRLR